MEDFDFYPEKPELKEKKKDKARDINKTIISIALFVFAFLILGFEDYNFILMIVSVVFIHEAGHFLMMKLFGYKNLQMTFVPFLGAYVNGKKDKEKQVHNWLIILAGPVPGILIGIALYVFGIQMKMEWMVNWSYLFVFLNVLNLIPLDPLDGGQLLKSFTGEKFELFQMIFSFISSLILIFIGWYFEIWVLMVFGFFMGFKIRSMQRIYQIHKDLKEESVNYTTTYKDLPNKDYYKIKDVLIENNPTLKKYISQFDDEELDGLIASQVANILVNPVEKSNSLLLKISVVLTWILVFLGPIWAFIFYVK